MGLVLNRICPLKSDRTELIDTATSRFKNPSLFWHVLRAAWDMPKKTISGFAHQILYKGRSPETGLVNC